MMNICLDLFTSFQFFILAGLRFGMMQVKAGLATTLHKFRVLPVEGISDYPARFDPAAFVTKVEGGNKVLLQPLDSRQAATS